MRFRKLFKAKYIAAIAVIIMAVMATIIVMSTRSSPPNIGIGQAAKTHTYLFIFYILALVATVILSIFVWTSSNKYHDAVKYDADIKIANANVEAAKANQLAAEANEKAETERLTRIKLEETLAPRTIVITGKTMEELKLFAGTKVFIVSLPDLEAWNVARQIKFMVGIPGWEVLGMEVSTPQIMAPAPSDILNGVHLLTRINRRTDLVDPYDTPWENAAKILNYQLKDSHIKVGFRGPVGKRSWPAHLSDDAILIQVGMKPQPYFDDKLLRDLQLDKRMEELEKEMEERLPPEMRKKAEEGKQWMKEQAERSADREKEDRQRIIEKQKRLLHKSPQSSN